MALNSSGGGCGTEEGTMPLRWTEELNRKLREDVAPVTPLLCSNGFAWHKDDLEDFADFYFNGRFRADDVVGKMALSRQMATKVKALDRTLAGFHYLERKQFEIEATLIAHIRGPKEFS